MNKGCFYRLFIIRYIIVYVIFFGFGNMLKVGVGLLKVENCIFGRL